MGLGLAIGMLMMLLWSINRSVPQAGQDNEKALMEYEVPAANIYLFKGVAGPSGKSFVKAAAINSWRQFHHSAVHGVAILLTDSNSAWLGLAQGFLSIGVPFTITTSVEEALAQPMVLVYPALAGNDFTTTELQQLARYSRKQAQSGYHPVLAVFNMQSSALSETFGVDRPAASRTRYKVALNPKLPVTRFFDVPEEQAWCLGDSAIYPEIYITHAYQPLNAPSTFPLMFYGGNNDSIAISYRQLDCGTRLLAWGVDLGEMLLRNGNARGYEGFKRFANVYEPGCDVLLRLLKTLYLESSPDAIALWPVPHAKGLVLNITHDVDFTRSITNAVEFGKWERSSGLKATYFLQTKYIKDWNDDLFLNALGAKCILELGQQGHELASHSVSHSHAFKTFPMGSGEEQYPDYRPYVMERNRCYNGSILGELRVSKFLVEHFSPGNTVTSFRPGHLSNPTALPQALLATGYQQVSTITACAMQSYLPIFTRYNRSRTGVLPIVELPITVEDELDGPMIDRLPQAIRLGRRLSAYGGYFNALIHTDTLDQKLRYEQGLVTALKPVAAILTVAEAGEWYRGFMSTTLNRITSNQLLLSSTQQNLPDGLCLMGPGIKKLMVPHGAMLTTTAGHGNVQVLLLPAIGAASLAIKIK